jgi:hypothetical protein
MSVPQQSVESVRVTVHGPGPHRVDHDLGRSAFVAVYDDLGEERFASVAHYVDWCEVTIGIFDLVSQQPGWVPDMDVEYRIVVTG